MLNIFDCEVNNEQFLDTANGSQYENQPQSVHAHTVLSRGLQ